MKKYLLLSTCSIFLSFFSFHVFAVGNVFAPHALKATAACPLVTSDTEKNGVFCQKFETASECQCASLGGDGCGTMQGVYQGMVGFYGQGDEKKGIDGGCAFGVMMGWVKYKQDCIDQWGCYLHGGYDTHHGQCGGSVVGGPGSACEHLT